MEVFINNDVITLLINIEEFSYSMLVQKKIKKIFSKKGFQGTTNEMNHVMLLFESKHLGPGHSSGKLVG